MTPRNLDSEEALEQAVESLFLSLDWQTVNAKDEVYGDPAHPPVGLYLGRMTRSEVLLRPRLYKALARINPGLPPEALVGAMDELARSRSAMSLVAANREIHQLLKDGVPVAFQGEDGTDRYERVRIIDWDNPAQNDFLLVRQLWVASDIYTRRADLVGFVNGLPLFFGELKAGHRRCEDAYRRNLADYKDTIPHLLRYNAFILLSNGSDAVLGTITSKWEHFSHWKKINSEGEEGVISLDTALRGTCPPARILDLTENYLLFHEAEGGLIKVLAMYYQYLGVEQALRAVAAIKQNQGRLGVFWHTQGSGKSFSMVFFSQKVLRKYTGNWTFLVITDRIDLDDQIYKNFARSGVVTENDTTVRAQSGDHLRQLLREDHRYLFTLIQKFGTLGGAPYPKLTDRDDIIVLTDEAHRTQYDVLAMNMRQALPNAAFIAFTATPLMLGAEEEKTRQVFGEYVSVYTFSQSNADRSTVPLYYENRVPEVHLTNPDLNLQIAELLEQAEADLEEEAALERQFGQEYEVITRDDRLERVAEDIVQHFFQRGFLGKAMVVSIDKLTAVRMYDKVRKYWRLAQERLQAEISAAPREKRDALLDRLAYMQSTDMAVVISEEQGEVEKFRRKGLDIQPHRTRIKTEDLDEKFKRPDDPFRIVFVCAMWRTGFDVPSCSTIYLDRPMTGHTLMQTIARANRVFGEKQSGLIVDYIGILREVKVALSIYGDGPHGEVPAGEDPVQDKSELVEDLRATTADAEAFCAAHGVQLDLILREADVFRRYALMDAAVESLLVSDEVKDRFAAFARQVDLLFRAILPDTRASEFAPRRHLLNVLAAKIRALQAPTDVSDLVEQVEELLDHSVEAKRYLIATGPILDLSELDFGALQRQFDAGQKRTQAERLRAAVARKIEQMMRLNSQRADFRAKFEALLMSYNEGSKNVEELFQELIELVRLLKEEEQRAISENLSEEELALFDLLNLPELHLSAAEQSKIKGAVRQLLEALKREKLVLDWRDRQQTLAAVRVAIRDQLWRDLPDSFSADLCAQVSNDIFLHIHDHYQSADKNTYTQAASPVSAGSY